MSIGSWLRPWQLRCCTAVALALAPTARAQSAATVPASSALYDRLEAISAWYPARGVFLGERPMSVRDVRRVVELLSRHVDSAAPDSRRDWARAELELMRAALGASGGPRAAFSWTALASGTNARVERIEPNGLGGLDTTTRRFIGIDALRHTFDYVDQGLPRDRAMLAIMPAGVASTERLAAGVEALIVTPAAERDSGRWAPLLHRAYVRGVAWNTALRAGAEEMRWGQSPTGAMFLSGNAAPLHAITLGTDTPVTLPWLFRYAGPFRLTGLLADLGATQTPSHARLAGWQGSIQPWSRFELGVAVLTHTGGNGAPKATFLQRFIDLFPAIDALAPQHADLQISNKVAGGNLRLRLPSGVDFYYELQIDDFDGRRLRSSLVEDAGHLLGLRVPVLVDGHLIGWRGEWQRTSLRLYEHSQFPSGLTYQHRILGNPIGPNAKRASLAAELQLSPSSRLEIEAADDRRDPSIFSATSNDPRDRGFRFVLDSLRPKIRRDRLLATIEQSVAGATARLSVGGARLSPGAAATRTEWFVALEVRRYRLRTF